MLLIITDVELLEGFSIFDVQNWPDTLKFSGEQHLTTLASLVIVDLNQVKRE